MLVVAEDLLARAGLASLLADQIGVNVVGQTDGRRLENEVEIYRPDVLVWDAGMEGVLLAFPDGLPVIALVADETTASDVRRIGVRGVLTRNATPRLIVTTMNAVFQGLVVLDSAFDNAPSPIAGSVPEAPDAVGVTPRELEVLRHLARGASNKAIAYELDISEHTIKFHVNSIMTKLNASSRTEAVVLATRMGLVPL